jgi:CBS domain-containing protein
MRRVNIQAAFVGEPSHASEALGEDGDEAVVLAIRGGDLTVVVPQGTPDARVLDNAGTIRGTLHLENEQVLAFEIQEDAVGAFVECEPADLHRRREQSGGVGMFTSTAGGSNLPASRAVARDLMRTDVVTTSRDASVVEAAALLAFHRITGLPVCEGDRLVGIVTEADVIGTKEGRTVGEVMTANVISIREDMPANDIATLLNQHRIRRVPVVREGKLVGIVSRGDIVRLVAAAHS